MITDMLNPYLLYIKLGLAALAVAGLIWFGWNEMAIRADLKAAKTEAALHKSAAEQAAKQFSDYVTLQKGIADAIQNVKIKSNNYIQAIESAPPPEADDGDPVVLVPGGLPVGATLPRLSGFPNNSTGRAPPAPAGDPGHQAGR